MLKWTCFHPYIILEIGKCDILEIDNRYKICKKKLLRRNKAECNIHYRVFPRISFVACDIYRIRVPNPFNPKGQLVRGKRRVRAKRRVGRVIASAP